MKRTLAAGLIAGLLTACGSTKVDTPPVVAPPTSSTTSSSSTTPPPPPPPPTTQAPAPIATGEPSGDCWTDLAAAVGWPTDTLPTLERIIRRESRCDPNAYADRPSTLDNSRGLLQMNAYGPLETSIRSLCGIDPTELFDPATNLRCGLAYYRAAGWAPWGGGA